MGDQVKQPRLLNLATMQSTLDRIVFENIDTGYNWQKASEALTSLKLELRQFFKNYIANNGDELPKSNSYWGLFMDLASKVLYFLTFVEQQLQAESNDVLQARYEAAISFLPNREHESNADFFDEICASYEAVTNKKLDVPNYSVQQTIENYYNYVLNLN